MLNWIQARKAKRMGSSSNGKKLANFLPQKPCKTWFSYQNTHFWSLKINQKQFIEKYFFIKKSWTLEKNSESLWLSCLELLPSSSSPHGSVALRVGGWLKTTSFAAGGGSFDLDQKEKNQGALPVEGGNLEVITWRRRATLQGGASGLVCGQQEPVLTHTFNIEVQRMKGP